MSFVTTQRVRVAIAVGCALVSVAAGCSSSSGSTLSTTGSTSPVAPLPATSAIQDESIPGIGATRAAWDATHTPNAVGTNGYGDDPSLPKYLTPSGAVYGGVSDFGTGRIQLYVLNMHTVDRFEILRRVRQELPSGATFAWELPLDRCYRVAFNSPTLRAAGGYMAEVRLQYILQDGTMATNRDGFNQAYFWLDGAGSPPAREGRCTG
jgi:hypothetical protein